MEASLKFFRRLLFVMLCPIVFTTGLVLTEKAFNINHMYVGVTVGAINND